MNMTFKKMLEERVANLLKENNVEKFETKYDCEKCRDLGYVFVSNDQGGEIAIECECLQRKQSLQKLEKCGLSDAFKKRTFKTYITDTKYQFEAKAKAMQFCKEFKESNSSLILCGKPGSGKTHLGVAVMLNLIEKNIGCKYEEYTSMIMTLKQSVLDEANFITEIDKYLNPRVVFIDDFLKGKPSDADLKYIYRVVNTRYLKGKPMIISTEMRMEDIIQWDEAIGSRIMEMCQGNVITFDEDCVNYRFVRN